MTFFQRLWGWLTGLCRHSTPIALPPVVVEVSDPDIIPPPDPDPKPNGLRHDWKQARAAWLYPGEKEYWIASHRMMTWTPEKIDAYLHHPNLQDTTHVIICPNTANRTATYETPFNALDGNEDHARAVFQQVIDADKAPILWCLSQEFLEQTLRSDHQKLLDHLRLTCELFFDLCHFAVPMRELGDKYSGSFMKDRNSVFLAMRHGAPDLPLACHERSLEEIPVDQFKDVGGWIISGLQTGFRTPTGGKKRKRDKITSPDQRHVYDGAAGFIASNARRMNRYVSDGHILEHHVNAVFEHSLPHIYEGQTWKPTRTLKEAKKRGKVFLAHGAEFDLSSGARRG